MKKSEILEQLFRWVEAKRAEPFAYPERTLSPHDDVIWKMGYKYGLNDVAQYLNIERISAEAAEKRDPLYIVEVECEPECPNYAEPRSIRDTRDPVEAIRFLAIASDKLHRTTIRRVD